MCIQEDKQCSGYENFDNANVAANSLMLFNCSGKEGRLQEPCEFPESANLLFSTSVYINREFPKPTTSICNQEDKKNSSCKESRLQEPCEFPESTNILSSICVHKMDDGKLIELFETYQHLYNENHELNKNNRCN
ncbi:unnamed protein product, partial [Tenebrio molitor]